MFGGQKSGSSTGLLHFCTFRLEAANDAQNVRVDTARGSGICQNCDIATYITKSLQMSDNPLYKLTTDNM